MTRPTQYPRNDLIRRSHRDHLYADYAAVTREGSAWGCRVPPGVVVTCTGRVSCWGGGKYVEVRVTSKKKKRGEYWFVPSRLLDVIDDDLKAPRRT
jgi:hypothetical protein